MPITPLPKVSPLPTQKSRSRSHSRTNTPAQNGRNAAEKVLLDHRLEELQGDIYEANEKHDPGTSSLHLFQRQIQDFDNELKILYNEARQLGRSAEFLIAVENLRESLQQLLLETKGNASCIFQDLGRVKILTKLAPYVEIEKNFYTALVHFNKAVESFSSRMSEYKEFPYHSKLEEVIEQFVAYMQYYDEILIKYQSRIFNPTIRRFIHEIALEIGEEIENMTKALRIYIQRDMPAMLSAQKTRTERFLNMSTVSTFFSAVTATILQITYSDSSNNPLEVAHVNPLLFASLIFSIGAALNSLLGLAWLQTVYGSRDHIIHRSVSIYMKGSPLIFLTIAIVCFLYGLIALVYNSQQTQVTKIISLLSTLITVLGLTGIAAAYAYERWFKYPQLRKLKKALFQPSSDSDAAESSPIRSSPSELDPPNSDQFMKTDVNSPERVLPMRWLRRKPKRARDGEAAPEVQSPKEPHQPTINLTTMKPPLNEATSSGNTTSESRWPKVLDEVMKATTWNSPFFPLPYHTPYHGAALISSEHLKSFEISQTCHLHENLVKKIVHVQFSPDGSMLATAIVGATYNPPGGGYIFRIGSLDATPTRFTEDQDINQIIWRQDGKRIAIRSVSERPSHKNRIGIITIDIDDTGAAKVTDSTVVWITRKYTIEYICWSADGEALLFIERDKVIMMNLDGTMEKAHQFDAMQLRSLTVVPYAAPRLLIVGSNQQKVSKGSRLRIQSKRLEKQLIVYNYKTQEVEDIVPLLDDARFIELGKTSDRDVLVSFKGEVPPQLWILKPAVRVGKMPPSFGSSLIRRHIYKPLQPAEFGGNACFGGESDQLIVALTTIGEILLWDRETEELLHTIPTYGIFFNNADLTCLSWNTKATDPLMFAVGSSDGCVHIWTNNASGGILGEESSSPSNLFQGTAERPILDGARGSASVGNLGRPTLSIHCEAESIKIQDLDAFSSSIPRIPSALNGIYDEGLWARVMQEISHSWCRESSHTPVSMSLLGPSSQARISRVRSVLHGWNAAWFKPSGWELRLQSKFDGARSAGPILDNDPPMQASSSTAIQGAAYHTVRNQEGGSRSAENGGYELHLVTVPSSSWKRPPSPHKSLSPLRI